MGMGWNGSCEAQKAMDEAYTEKLKKIRPKKILSFLLYWIIGTAIVSGFGGAVVGLGYLAYLWNWLIWVYIAAGLGAIIAYLIYRERYGIPTRDGYVFWW